MAGGIADVQALLEVRTHQAQALCALDEAWAQGRKRAWVVLPPGTGKTLTGLEAARRLGQPAVVFGPNTAIQGQWIAEWERMGGAAGTSRELTDAVTVLTYQALATFDPDAEVDEDGGAAPSHLERLRPSGQALVEAMRALGPFTLLLDECHHLLDTWGELVAELLRDLPDAYVIGLTATPPERLTTTEAELVDELFGPAVLGPSIPAVVREGDLAPFAELAWLTAPTAEEAGWLAGESERFRELTTDLLDPGFATTSFLSWLDERIVTRGKAGSTGPALTWHRFEREYPDLAAAGLRFHHQGLLALPAGARLREEHRHAPTAADWVCLLDDYIGRCLKRSSAAQDEAAVEAIRAALPSVGYQLTTRGIRGGRSPVDRVLARSAAKTRAVREILGTESSVLGDRLRAVVLCDHEQATATLPARLTGVLDAQAGAARLVLDELVADERTADLGPMLITGRTVAAAPGTAERFVAYCAERGAGFDLELRPGAGGSVEVTGPGAWQSRRWVPLATRFFESGGTRALIGTRGMLGEGWDARGVNTLVDLTEATTPTAVVQTRGRALRIDPGWPEKVANTWSVVCLAQDHPRGAGDWDRFVRKHDGYFGITETGAIMAGVAHVHPELSPYAPPDEGDFDRLNSLMLQRAAERDRIRELWRVGEPYDDQLVHTIRIMPARALPSLRPAAARPDLQERRRPGGPRPQRHGLASLHPPSPEPAVRMAKRRARSAAWAAAVLPIVPAAAVMMVPMVPAAIVGVWIVGAVAAILASRYRYRRVYRAVYEPAWQALLGDAGARALDEARRPDLLALAYALADGMRNAGLTRRGAEAVSAEPDETGAYRVQLQHVPPAQSADFATALDELISPITAPRYLIHRYVVTGRGPEAGRALFGAAPPANAIVHHAVPTVLGENKKRVTAFAAAWAYWVNTAEPVYTRSPEGEGRLAAQAGASPMDVTTTMRAAWA